MGLTTVVNAGDETESDEGLQKIDDLGDLIDTAWSQPILNVVFMNGGVKYQSGEETTYQLQSTYKSFSVVYRCFSENWKV
jgi:hypothetical protein